MFVCLYLALRGVSCRDVHSCEIPCDSDCQVGEWSAWSPCAAPVCIRRSRRQQQQFVDKTNTSPDDQGDEDQGDDDRGGAVVDGQGKQTKQLLRDINQGDDELTLSLTPSGGVAKKKENQ